jgi:tetratricopeptide (TPR) repeat protein
VEAADLKGALASHRHSLVIRSELAGEHPENQVYADNVSTARYYLASVLGRLGQWEEALGYHRQNLAQNPTGSFLNCRVGEALIALGRHEEALRYLQRALSQHALDLRADTVNLFRKLAVVEDEARICKTLARLGQPDAPDNCRRATRFMDAIEVEPEHAFPRAFMAAAWTNLGDAYEIMGTRSAAPAADRRSYRAAALDMRERSLTIWSDLEARKLVSPVDTGLITAARRAVANAKALARTP